MYRAPVNGAICDCVGTSEAEPFIVKDFLCLCFYHSTENLQKLLWVVASILHLPVGLVRKPVVVFMYKYSKVIVNFSLVPALSYGGGGKRAWYTLCTHAPSSCIGQVCLRPHWRVIFTLRHITGNFEVKSSIASTVTVCIALFEVIGELQRKRLHWSHAAVFCWNARMHGQ